MSNLANEKFMGYSDMQLDLRCGDSLELLSTLADESVNLIVTSPPYADARKSTYGGVKPDEYVAWFLPFAQELQRVLTPDGSFVLNIKERVVSGQRHLYVYQLVQALVDSGWLWTEEYMWHKTTTTPGKWPNRFRDSWEHLYHFTKSKTFVMNQDAVKVLVGDWSKTRLSNLSDTDRTRDKSATGSNYGKAVSNWVGRDMVFPTNVLHGSSETKNVGHPAAFPVWLPQWFVSLFSNSGDVVLDPFVGSGSTGVASVGLGRNFIGFDAVSDYVDIAKTRIGSVET